MSLSRFATKAVACGCLALAAPSLSFASNYATHGGEYAIAGKWPGDQVHPQVAVSPTGGYMVWEDNITDGSGLGVSAMKLDSSLSGSLAPFRVNSIGADDQERPQVALLKDGGAAFVWQGGKLSFQHIYARFISASNTWVTSDVQVNATTNYFQKDPVATTLAGGNVLVVWSSVNQQSSNSMQDVYGQLFSPDGQKVRTEFPINQFAKYNQRTPAVAALAGGGFVVAWVSEQQRVGQNPTTNQVLQLSQLAAPSVDIYARVYDANGNPLANEFLVNSTSAVVCANPVIAAGGDGGFLIGWSQKAFERTLDSWDVYARPFSATSVGGNAVRVNSYTYGDQFAPRVSAAGADYLMVWTSLAQDGNKDGVFGQFLNADASNSGTEFKVNTTWISKQIHPSVSSDKKGQFLVAWTSFGGGVESFDLYAQRFAKVSDPLLPMDAPFVTVPFALSNGVYQPQIQVSWALQAGLPVDHYEVYVDGSPSSSAAVTTNGWTLSGLAPNSTHSFQVAYVTSDGSRSPLSPSSTATTWGGYSWGGVPFEWMTSYYGSDLSKWPAANSTLTKDGPTLLQVFLTGANPMAPATWLKTEIVSTSQGMFLNWNPQAGLVYQVQMSPDLSSWTNVGTARLATGAQDSIFVGGSSAAYYRVLRLR
jgi:hypothetical protein